MGDSLMKRQRPIESYIIPEAQSLKHPYLEAICYIVALALIVAATLWAVSYDPPVKPSAVWTQDVKGALVPMKHK